MLFGNKMKVQKDEIKDLVKREVGTCGGEDTRCFLMKRIDSSAECYVADADFNDLTSLHLINGCKVAVDHIYAPFKSNNCWISVIDVSDRLRKLGGPKAIYEDSRHCDQTKKWYKRVDCMINEFDNIDLVAHPIMIEGNSNGYEIIDGCHRILAKILKDGPDFKFKVFILEH